MAHRTIPVRELPLVEPLVDPLVALPIAVSKFVFELVLNNNLFLPSDMRGLQTY